MVSDPEVVVRLARLTKELDADTAALDARGREIGELTQAWATAGGLARPELVLLAVNLHGWYTALETALERVARLLDQTVPAGNTWHVDLLAQMQVEIPGLRPSVVPAQRSPNCTSCESSGTSSATPTCLISIQPSCASGPSLYSASASRSSMASVACARTSPRPSPS